MACPVNLVNLVPSRPILAPRNVFHARLALVIRRIRLCVVHARLVPLLFLARRVRLVCRVRLPMLEGHVSPVLQDKVTLVRQIRVTHALRVRVQWKAVSAFVVPKAVSHEKVDCVYLVRQDGTPMRTKQRAWNVRWAGSHPMASLVCLVLQARLPLRQERWNANCVGLAPPPMRVVPRVCLAKPDLVQWMVVSACCVCLVRLPVRVAHVYHVRQDKVTPHPLLANVRLVPPDRVRSRAVSARNAQWAKSPILADNAKTARQVLVPRWVACVSRVLQANRPFLEAFVCRVRKASSPLREACANRALLDIAVCQARRLASRVE